VRRAYKFRLRPTKGQHLRLQACLDDHREIYNAALEERRDAYERVVRRSDGFFGPARPKTPVRYGTQSAQLRDIRAARPEMARWSFSSQQATLRRLDKAFGAFFSRVGGGAKPGYPRFKAAHRFDSVEWPKDGDGCRWKPEAGRVYLQGVGDVKVTAHRSVAGTLKTIQVRRAGRKWMLVLSCDDVPAKLLEPTGQAAGVDVGINVFAAVTDPGFAAGGLVENPRWARAGAERLATAQQALARKQRGSANRRAARETIAARHRKIANQRADFHHKTARKLVERYDVIVIEKLKITNMVRSAKGTAERPGTNVAAKSGLNRSIADAGWGAFVSILKSKAEEAGRTVIDDVEPAYTSQTCHACGHVDAANRTGTVFRCLVCGHADHADINAARNILRAGLAPPTATAA
jgi:putative transposase